MFVSLFGGELCGVAAQSKSALRALRKVPASLTGGHVLPSGGAKKRAEAERGSRSNRCYEEAEVY